MRKLNYSTISELRRFQIQAARRSLKDPRHGQLAVFLAAYLVQAGARPL